MLSSEQLLPLVLWILNAWHEDTLGFCVVGFRNIVGTLTLFHIKIDSKLGQKPQRDHKTFVLQNGHCKGLTCCMSLELHHFLFATKQSRSTIFSRLHNQGKAFSEQKTILS